MKKLVTILLFTAFLLCNAGFYFSYLVGKIKVHAQVEAMMDKLHDDQLITIADTSIQESNWESKDKEFSYKDEMYDVVKVDTVNGQKVFHCLNDTKETSLEKGFAEQIEKQQGGKKTSTVLFLKIACVPFSNGIVTEPHISFSSKVYPPILVTKIVTRVQDILHPPPTA